MSVSLVFIRNNRKHGKIYRELCLRKGLQYQESIIKITDEAKDADYIITGSPQRIFHHSVYQREVQNFVNQIDFDAVLKRERSFRSAGFSRVDALRMCYSVISDFLAILKKYNVKRLITLPVDNFILDIICLMCDIQGIEVIGLQRFSDTKVRRTIRGEYNFVRNVEAQEVEEYLEIFKNNANSPFKISKSLFYTNLARDIASYKLKYLWHYLVLFKIFRFYKYRYYSTTSGSYIKDIISRYKFYRRNLVKYIPPIAARESVVYVPLHYYPEATIEYWTDADVSDYYMSLSKTVERLTSEGYIVFLKEHPSAFMRRDVTPLIDLLLLEDVHLLSPWINTFDVLKTVAAVIIWTGTTGLEALTMGVPVYFVTKNSYNPNLLNGLDDFLNGQKVKESLSAYSAMTNFLGTCECI